MLKFLSSKKFLINLAAAIFLIILIIWSIFKFIDSYTFHGESISVPSLEGLSITEVEEILNEKNLRYTIVDSIYILNSEKGIVLDQNPLPGDLVKEKRTIYITTSKIDPPKISMPNVVDMSLRLAVAKLESYGLKVGPPKYIPSECVNCVIRQVINGKEVKLGDKVKKGSIVQLVVGMGTSNEKVIAPYLISLTMEEATSKIFESSLNIGFSDYTDCKCVTKQDTMNAIVYRQSPERSQNNPVNMGSSVDLYFTCDKNLVNFNPPPDSLNADSAK